MGLYHDEACSAPNSSAGLPAFMPIHSLSEAKPAESALNATLPNGVKLTLQSVALSDLPLLLNALAALPCSVSNRD
ncbi:transposase [Methylomonas sp. ZR1]|nr:transposase [Methylomonas sp. ZR1]